MSNQVVSPALTRPEALTVIGVSLALTAIIQKPLLTGKLYGFWTPQQGGGRNRSDHSSTTAISPDGCSWCCPSRSAFCAPASSWRRRDTLSGQR